MSRGWGEELEARAKALYSRLRQSSHDLAVFAMWRGCVLQLGIKLLLHIENDDDKKTSVIASSGLQDRGELRRVIAL